MMQKGTRVSRWAIAIIVLLIVGAVVPIRGHDVTTSGAQAIWSKDEIFIFVSQNKLAWSNNVWTFTWQMAKDALGLASPPTFKRIDCLVYRVTNTAIGEHSVKDLNAAGIFVPYRGSIYALIGGESHRTLKWEGDRFTAVPAAEAAALDGSFTYTDELLKREGWAQTFLFPVRGSADNQLILGGASMTVRATQSADGESKIELIKTNDSKGSQVLYRFKNTGGFLSADGYKHLVE